jgi:Rad3-related DNA helicase
MATNSSLATLYSEADRLDNRSLDVFISHIMSLRVRRETSDIQKQEALLLKKINHSLSIDKIERFRELNEKRLENELSEPEKAELIFLLDKVEQLNVSRIKHLTSLARLKNISVRQLMKELGINTSVNG